MAIAAGAFELRTTGNDFNAGYFNAARGGTDYSQQDAPQLTALQEIVSDGSTTLSSTSGLFTAAMVGNGLMLGPGGSGVLYEIVSVADAFHATVDRAVAAAVDQDVRIGGALASPGRTSQLINASAVSGNKVYQKSGTYTITTTTANVAGGRVNLTVDNLYWIGYGAARGDDGHQAGDLGGHADQLHDLQLREQQLDRPQCRGRRQQQDRRRRLRPLGRHGVDGAQVPRPQLPRQRLQRRRTHAAGQLPGHRQQLRHHHQ
jgi:hypothetical protein